MSAQAQRMTARILVLALLLVAAWIVGVLWLWPQDPVRTPQMRAPQLPALTAESYRSEGLEQALQRPLFWESRQPVAEEPEPEVAAPAPVTQAPPLDTLRLLGLVLAGEQRTAIIEHDGQVLRLLEGESVADWQLLRIYPTEVELGAGRHEVRLQLHPERSPTIKME